MQMIDSLLEARWVIPGEPAGCVLEHAAIAVDRGRILAVLPRDEAVKRFQARERIERGSHVLLPGLVNAHTHAAMTLFRGLADDLPLMEWLERHIWPAEARWVDADFVRDGARLAMAEMLKGGITCFNDMYFFPDVVAAAAGECGMRVSVGMVVAGIPSAWAATAAEYLSRGLEVRDAVRDQPLVSVVFAPHSPYAVDDDTLLKLRRLADELELGVHMHVHETAEEVRRSLREHGRRPLARLDALGLVGPDLQAVHMTQLEDGEIERCAQAGVSVVHCPESNLKLASGVCPVARLLEAGVNVALGTDGAASNNDLDMLGEMRTAALLGKITAADPCALPAAATLHMATLGSARALGLAAGIGSLEAGKWADVACLDLARACTQPVHDPLAQVVYAAGRDQVTDVWVAGRRLLADGRLTTLDERLLIERADVWRDRVGRPEPKWSEARQPTLPKDAAMP
ncbi:MAG TPA: TRZ/ATZ family hydrolase [Gammaproteobacteria bacterium]|nr:TRZ/ATZ family hydrolase [Gammaproteobacteria bacterium]